MVYVVARDLLVKDPLMELVDTADAAGVICASCLHDVANKKKASIAKSVILALQFEFNVFIIVKLIRITIVNLHKILNSK